MQDSSRSDLYEKFIDFISKENLFQAKDRLLLAVSGGVDSVVLCELCQAAGFEFIIAHCNFQLRGEESSRDEMFVRSLGNKYGVRVLVRSFDTEKYALLHRVSIQVAARELRYDWFNELIEKRKSETDTKRIVIKEEALTPALLKHEEDSIDFQPQFIVTAHHLDDNIETVLMNFFKGTGVAGMRGMLPKTGALLRPLLFAHKEELLKYASERSLLFVEDSSNSSDKYSRNYFRRQIIPMIQKIYPGAEQNLAGNIERSKEIEALYNQAIQFHKNKILEKRGDEIHIPVLKLSKVHPQKTIVYEIVKDFGFSVKQTEEIIRLIDSESGKFILSPTHRILKNRNWFIISKLGSETEGTIVIEENQNKVRFESGALELECFAWNREKILQDNQVAMLDSDRVQFPLILRKWKKGDYFYPLGMPKKKKLSRFFIDQKLSVSEKEKIWVIEMNKKIIWVIGKRIDDRMKITDATKTVLRISLTTN